MNNLGFLVAVVCMLSGCDPVRKDAVPATPTEPSPNASILPAPLATDLETGRKAGPADAGRLMEAGTEAAAPSINAPPEPLREDTSLASDSAPREALGIRAHARLRWLDQPPFPRLPESNTEASQRLRDALDFELVLELGSSGRLRVLLDSDAFVLPRGTEFRSRADRLGQLIVWDAGAKYAVVPAGALRAVLSERRSDKAPVVKPKITEIGSGNLLGLPTEKRELVTPLGRLVLDQANIAPAGVGAELVCRWLADWINADPLNASCARPLLPVRAEIFSGAGGHLLFEIYRVDRDPGFDPLALLAPPAGARFVPGELPPESPWIVPSAERLREMRLRPAPRTEKPAPAAPKQGLVVHNKSESLRYVLLDGVVVARIPPHREVYVEALLPGKYALTTLDFLGDDPTPLHIIELPARVALGEDVEPSH